MFKVRPIGLNNFTGTACYYNSLLQFGFNNPTVFNCILTYEDYFNKSKVGAELVKYVKNYTAAGEAIAEKLGMVAGKCGATDIHISLFNSIKDEMDLKLPALKFPNGQEDAFDMMRHIIELTNLPLINSKSVGGIIPDDELNPLNQLVNLVYDNYIRCHHCNKMIKLDTRSNE